MHSCTIFVSIVPSEPLNLRYVNVTAASIRVFWDPPAERNGLLVNYVLEYYLEMSTELPDVLNDIQLGMEQEGVLIEQLMEYDRYTVRVAARTDKGRGNFSRPLNVLTDEHGTYIYTV